MAKAMTDTRPAEKETGPDRLEEPLPCAWCGQSFGPAELVWVGSERAWLCPACRAEAESCGCAD